MTTEPTTNQRERMGRVIRLITDLQDAAGVDPREQRLSLLLIETLYEASDDQLQVLQDIISACAQLEASYLTVDQVAARLRIKPKLVKQLAKWGSLEGMKLRRGWLFTQEAFDRFVERNEYCGDIRCVDLEAITRKV